LQAVLSGGIDLGNNTSTHRPDFPPIVDRMDRPYATPPYEPTEANPDASLSDVPISNDAAEEPPYWLANRSFWSMTVTQMLGAFNDTIFKQFVLLLLVRVAIRPGDDPIDMQWIGTAIFSVPFVLFSGTAGWLADRVSKWNVVVLSKVGEIVVMLGGVAAFATMRPVEYDGHLMITTGLPWFVLAVLCLMGVQSAFFGPSKYAILPEISRNRDLPAFNGVFQMTTFVALIVGVGIGGYLMDLFKGRLWGAAMVCVVIAVLGTTTSIFVRQRPAAKSDLPYTPGAAFISKETWQLLTSDRTLFWSLLVYTLFWFAGAIVQPTVNAVGKIQFQMSNTTTSIMVAAMGLGIAVGCMLSAMLSRKQVRFRLVKIGTVGMIVCLVGTSIVSQLASNLNALEATQRLGFWGTIPLLGLTGMFGGLYAVPLQVFLQARPPNDQKGRIIGSMNLVNWIAVIASAGVYGVFSWIVESTPIPPSTIYAATSLFLVPVLIWFHPADAEL